jgi:hypothetical protein
MIPAEIYFFSSSPVSPGACPSIGMPAIKSSFQLVVYFSIIIDYTGKIHHLSQEFNPSLFQHFSDIRRSVIFAPALSD